MKMNTMNIDERKYDNAEKDCVKSEDIKSEGTKSEDTKSVCRLILASGSPRRKELMEQIGLKPEIHPSTLKENPKSTAPEKVVSELSSQKAHDVMTKMCEEARKEGKKFTGVVIGSDTVVSIDDKIMGKPSDREDAIRMIRQIQGRSHIVYTGVTILTEDNEDVFSVETRVNVYPMSNEEIEAYVDRGESMDKAGAYGIQGGFAAHIRGIDGSYTNVMGLPVGRLYQELKRICPDKLKVFEKANKQ